MHKNVLILGCTGTLGQALVSEFKIRGYQVTALDKVDIDVTSPDLEDKILKYNPDIIINSTAYNAVDKAETEDAETKLAFALNAYAPGNIAKAAKKLGAIMVHYSTNYVFDGKNKNGYSENDQTHPINKYGQSKLEGEQNVQKESEKYYIIRLSRLFGVRGTAETSKRTFIEIMKNEINKKELEVGNTEVSALTYAPDLAEFTRKLVESGKPYGIYHGTNEGQCTWYEWAKEIFKDLKKGPRVIPVESLTPKLTKHPVHATLLNTKFDKQRSWQKALAEFLQE